MNRRDIKEAVSWYESREPGLGIRFKLEARTATRRIGDNALMFPAIDERSRRALLSSFPYAVYFTVEATEVVKSPRSCINTDIPTRG